MFVGLVVAAALFLAYANGANDNFKGVATLYGSFTANYRTALWIGTIATFAGSMSSLLIATELIKMFSGSGVVPAEVASSPVFAVSIASAAAATIILATFLGLPVSTTHALTGAIIGAGLVSVGWSLDVGILGRSFLLPLLLSPVAAVLLAIPLYRLLHAIAQRSAIRRDTCICLDGSRLLPVRSLKLAGGEEHYAVAALEPHGELVTVGSIAQCIEKYDGRIIGMSVRGLTDGLHFLSAAAVSFSRGLNDAPKIMGLLLVVELLEPGFGIAAIATAMAIGGLINARKVAITMGRRISRMNDGQALSANLVTAFLVIVASRLGMPVSTTQVSVGAITGVGLVNRSVDGGVLRAILVSWLLTLPIACLLGAALAIGMRAFG